MRSPVRFSLLVLIACAILATAATAAQAAPEFGVEKFFAANCKVEACGEKAVPPKTLIEAEAQGYQPAGGHPPFGVSDFILNTQFDKEGVKEPVENVKTIRLDVAPGAVTNPQAVTRCSLADFGKEIIKGIAFESTCPKSSELGVNKVVVYTEFPEKSGKHIDIELEGKVYNLEPPEGSGLASDFGVALDIKKELAGKKLFAHTFIEGNVEWASDYHDYYEIHGVAPGLIESRLIFTGNAAGTSGFLRNPSKCVVPGPETTTTLTVESYGGTKAPPAPYEAPIGTTKCGEELFEPKFKLVPESTLSDRPDGVTAELTATHPEEAKETDTSDLQAATVKLPEGMTPNESALAGIEGCTPEQIGIGTRNPVECPPHSRIGTVNIEVPRLPAGQLRGVIFLGKPAAGSITEPPFTIYLDAESTRYAVKVRLKGTIELNPTTGRIEATFAENPAAPFNAVILHFDGGAHATLANPLACTTGKTATEFVPFSAPATTLHSELPFSTEGCSSPPSFSLTQSTSAEPPTAGASTSFKFTLNRSDGNQYPATIRTVLPPGLVGQIPRASLCPEAQANSESETCPASSRIGQVRAAVGAGPDPYVFTGSAFLTGPYAGAPYGLSLKVPIVAGPFNLGTEVKRAKIEVDPHTARVIVTGELPTVRRHIRVRLKSLAVTVNRQGFELNPTNCGVLADESTLSSTLGALATLSSPFQAEGCNALAFKPSLSASTSGKTSKANGASLEVKISQGAGQANIRSVKTSLPIALPSRLTTLQKACLEATFAANPLSCPAGSNVGTATAVTPVLPNPMTGPAYLVSHGGAAFPDLDLVLEEKSGVRVIVVGNTDIKKGITTTTFAANPDVPVSSFVLNLPTGPHSALAAYGNLCAKKLVMPTTLVGQNGAQINQNTKISPTGCPVRILSSRTSGSTAILKVQTYEAGRVSTSGNSVKAISQRVGGASTTTLKVPLSARGNRRHRPFKTRVRVSFVPSKKGAPRSRASALLRFR